MTVFPQRISEQIWDMKYRLKDQDGTPIDEDVQATWRRIAHALAKAESKPEVWESVFYDALSDFKFVPAGRIVSGAGTDRSVTLFNCLAADTLIPTNKGMVRVDEVAGTDVDVLDGDGQWVNAPMNRFGEQPVASVVLKGGYNGRERRIVRATEGHRWVLEDQPEKTTKTLSVGDRLKRVARRDVRHSTQYQMGVVHGIIYGDGTKSYQPKGGLPRYFIRLCGEKVELLQHFEAVQESLFMSVSSPASFEGDLLVSVEGFCDLKALPSGATCVEYLTGFLRGWFATDGCVDSRDGRAILSCGDDEAAWLERWGAISGMEVSYKSALVQNTNFGPRKKSIYNVVFTKWTMMPFDLLREKHRKNFGEPLKYFWEVVDIGDYGDPEPVFCPRVYSTDSVQLHSGIHTGQCYVMGTIPDSLPGIFQNLKEAALTMQQGGGIGYDFSTIRPKGAPVKGVAADASGPLSFMDVWDSMCRTIMSAGSRRGAMMATMRCDHPDIEDFIDAKKDPARLRMFNLSVLVTDEFMGAVKHGHNWRLHFEDRHGKTMVEKVVDARELWNKIMRSTYDYAEPGVIFIDRINQANNLNYIEKIASTNPCGEQPLPPYGACLLGSINLARLVQNPYMGKPGFKTKTRARIDQKELTDLVAVAVRMMDNVIDVSNFPLPEQEAEAKAKRRIGLGVTGLANALIMCGLTYGSPEAVEQTEKWMKWIACAAYEASVELAKEKGAFPLFDSAKFLNSGFMQSMPHIIRDKIATHGIRNALLTSIAPTGTISLLAGNVSSGIEPVFAASYTRKVLQPDGTKTEERVVDYALKVWEEMASARPEEDPALPPAYVDAQTLDPMAHVRMQAAAQRWVDSSISKTINCPEDITFEDFENVYMAAWDTGCKGCTTYRPNEVTGSVLSVDPKPAEPQPTATPEKPVLLAPAPRPDVLEGRVYKMKWPTSAHSIYVTITDILEDGKRRPFEVFVNSKDPSHFAWTVGLTRMISAIFRRPHDSRFVVEELKAVFDPKGGAWMEGRYVPSILAALGHVIERHMKTIGYIESDEELTKDDTETEIEAVPTPGATCPSCGSYNVASQSGCLVCKDCGHSNCG